MNAFRTQKTIRQVGWILVWVVLVAITASAQTVQRTPELNLNEPLEIGLSGNEPHEYQMTLKANEFVQVRVEQKRIDVVLRLYSPDGTMLAEMDSPTGPNGYETLSWSASTPGIHRLEVKRLEEPGNPQSGQYEIKLTARNAVTEANRQRIKAEALFMKVIKLRIVTRNEIPGLLEQWETLLTTWQDVNDEYMTGLIKGIITNLKAAKAEDEAFARAEAETDANTETKEVEEASKARLVVQTGHPNTIQSVGFSVDGKLLLSMDLGGSSLILWDVETGQQLKSLTGQVNFATSFAFSPDNTRLAIGRGNGSILLFDTQTGQRLKSLAGHDGIVSSLAFLHGGKTLASSGGDMTVKLWNIEAGLQKNSWKVERGLMGFSPDGNLSVSLGSDHSIVLWDTETGKQLKKLAGQAKAIRSIEISNNGKRLAALGPDDRITIWNIETGEQLCSFKGHEVIVSQMAFSPDGMKLVSCSAFHDTLMLWDTETGEHLKSLKSSIFGVHSLAFSSDGKALAFGTFGRIELWNFETLKEVKTLGGQARSIHAVTFSPDGNTIVIGSGRSIKLWHIGTGEQLTTLGDQNTLGDLAAFSPDGKLLAWIENTSTDIGRQAIALWDIKAARRVTLLAEHTRSITSIAFSPDSKTVISGSLDGTIKIWDIGTGQEVKSLLNDAYSGSHLAFSPDGRIFASGGSEDRIIKLWNAETREPVKTLSGQTSFVESLTFSPDGRTLAVGGKNGSIQLWNVDTGQQLNPLIGHAGSVDSVVFSPDGRLLASGGSDNFVKLWHVATGQLVQSFIGHTDNIQAIAFSPDSKFLVSASWDSTVRLWGVKGDSLATLIALDKNDWAVVTPNGLFDASPGARRLMHYVIGLEPVRLEQIKDIYFVPGLLQKIIKDEVLPKVTLFSAKDLFPLVDYKPPEQNQTAFDVRLVNRGGGIGQLQVFINGKECGPESGVNSRPPSFSPNQPSLTMQIDLGKCGLLLPGEQNRVEVVTYNAAGSINSRSSTRGAEFISLGDGLDKVKPPNIYIIGGGISRYTGSSLNLRYAAKDAEDFIKALEIGATKLVGAGKVHIRLLTSNGEKSGVKFSVTDARVSLATKDNFERAFADFGNATPNDLFIVYLAGHGISVNLNQNPLQAGGDTYLYLTQEATTTDTSVLSVSNSRGAMAISSDELADWMKQNKALKQVLILDTCAAGAAATSLVAKRDLPSDQIKAIDRLQNRIGFFVLMGAAADKTSYETTQYGHGLLTYSLLHGMKGGIKLRDDKFADVGLLFSYVQDAVPELAKNIGGLQRPLVLSPQPSVAFNQSGSFDIGMFTAAEQGLITLSSPKPLLLRPILISRDENYDNLNLTPLLREELRAVNQVAFVDADEMVGAIKPSGSYRVEGHSIIVNMRLIRDGVPVGKMLTIKGRGREKEQLIKQLTTLIQANVQMQVLN